MPSRRAGREQAFQLLYHLELVEGDPSLEIENFWRLNPDESGSRGFAERLVRKVLEHREEIDRLISEASARWSIRRMDAVSRCLLRLGACEILHFPETPPQVAIDEAVELAKHYGPETSFAFVNGILDRLLQEKTLA